MNTLKKCTKCFIEKNKSEFNNQADCKDGLRPECRECKANIDKLYREKNKEKLSIKNKTKHKEITKNILSNRIKELKAEFDGVEYGSFKINGYLGKYIPNGKYSRHYFEIECKFCGDKSKKNASYIKSSIIKNTTCGKCKETINIHTNEKYCCMCDKWMPATIKYFVISKNRKRKLTTYCKKCSRERNIKLRLDVEYRKREYEYVKRRLKTDMMFKCTRGIRNNVRSAFLTTGYSKNTSTYKILQIGFPEFKIYIENQFVKGMSWENHGKWHFDHKLPMSLAKTYDEAVELCHYSNYQPMWAYDNLSKSDKINLDCLNPNDLIRFDKFILRKTH